MNEPKPIDGYSCDLGQEVVWNQVFKDGIKVSEQSGHRNWNHERTAAIAILRELCAEFGDNSWPDTLHLADVIEKHLGKHLWQAKDASPA